MNGEYSDKYKSSLEHGLTLLQSKEGQNPRNPNLLSKRLNHKVILYCIILHYIILNYIVWMGVQHHLSSESTTAGTAGNTKVMGIFVNIKEIRLLKQKVLHISTHLSFTSKRSWSHLLIYICSSGMSFSSIRSMKIWTLGHSLQRNSKKRTKQHDWVTKILSYEYTKIFGL